MSFNLDNYQPTDIDNTEALVQWLRETRIDEIECLLPDVNGMMRGKIVPCADFIQSLDTDSLHLPETLMHVTSWAKWCRSRHARCRSEYS